MSGIPKDWWDEPQVVARSLVGITPPDPIADQETECGILAQNADISQSESAYYSLADAEAAIKGAHDDDRR